MKSVAENPERYLATAAEMLTAEGKRDAAEILRTATAKIEETGFNNWNGGTTTWTVYLLVTPTSYTRLGNKRDGLETQISDRLKPVFSQVTSDWFDVKISPKIKSHAEWQSPVGNVSHITRQHIIDGLKVDEIEWNGCLNDVEFLERLYDLKSLPSDDKRFKNAAGDIWQHRVNNPDDWPDDWVYDDVRIGLLQGSADGFLRFLCEMLHPVVRKDRNETLRLVQHFNDQLYRDGWALVDEEKIAGRPYFVAKRIQIAGGYSIFRARKVSQALDADRMQVEIERMENAIEPDPSLAIGTAKDIVESCCKSILSKRGVEFSRSITLPQLTKLLAKELKLVPEGISDEAKGANTIRLILQNLTALTHHLAELRGLYGSGHGRDGNHRGLEARHARLSASVATAFIVFMTETYHQREKLK